VFPAALLSGAPRPGRATTAQQCLMNKEEDFIDPSSLWQKPELQDQEKPSRKIVGCASIFVAINCIF
jgi:hypothetical protein